MSKDTLDANIEGKKVFIESFTEQVKDAFELKDEIKIVYCPQYTPMGRNAKACIEPATMTMYISIIHLRTMSIEDIRKTVSHEITHKFELEHTPEFHRILNELLAGTWTPIYSSGIIIINGNKRIEKPVKTVKEEKEEIDKTRCNFIQCLKKTETKRCVHCRGYYCKDHIKPIPPSFPKFDYPNKYNEWKNRKNGHPCPEYYMYLIREEKERSKKLARKSFGNYRYLRVIKEHRKETGEDFKSIEKIEAWKKEEDSKADLEKKCKWCHMIKNDDGSDLKECENCHHWFCNKHLPALTANEALGGEVGHICDYKPKIKEKEELDTKINDTNKLDIKWKAILIFMGIVAIVSVGLFISRILGYF